MRMSDHCSIKRAKREAEITQVSEQIKKIEGEYYHPFRTLHPSPEDHNHLIQLRGRMHVLKDERFRTTLYKGENYVGYVLLNQYDIDLLRAHYPLVNNPGDGENIFVLSKLTEDWWLEWWEGRIKIVTDKRLKKLNLRYKNHILFTQLAVDCL